MAPCYRWGRDRGGTWETGGEQWGPGGHVDMRVVYGVGEVVVVYVADVMVVVVVVADWW